MSVIPAQRVIRDVTARGVRMRVIEAGEGNGPPLVLVHTFLLSHLSFDDIIDDLSQNFHVIAPDLPGFGESEKPNPTRYEYSIEAFAEAVADLISAYGLGRSSVVGHGLGGAVAITLATHHAELIDRLVLVDPLCYPSPTNRTWQPSLTPVIGSVIFKQFFGRRSFRSYFKEEYFSHQSDLPIDRIDLLYQHFNTPAARESAYAVLKSMIDTRAVVARVTRVRQPTLITWGRDDCIYPSAYAFKLTREIPNAQLELFDAGHAPHEERPHDFTAVVSAFIKGTR